MGKIYKDTYCIYLDQFAISLLSEDKLDNEWTLIKHLLQKGVRDGNCFVPYSNEHLLECSYSTPENAIKKERLLYSLSNEKMVEIEPEINARFLVAAVRERKMTGNSFFKNTEGLGYSNELMFQKFHNLKSLYNEMTSEATRSLNMMRTATRRTGHGERAANSQALIRTVSVYSNELVSRLRQFHSTGSFKNRDLQFSMATIPFWADQVMEILLDKYRVTKREAQHAANLLEIKGLKNTIPTLYIRTAIETMMAVKHQQETVNDYVDISRLSTALPVADVVLTDKARYFDLTYFDIDKDFDVQLFSGKKEHIQQFSQWLSTKLA